MGKRGGGAGGEGGRGGHVTFDFRHITQGNSTELIVQAEATRRRVKR